MAVERVATNNQTQYLLSQITQANQALDQTQAQVASGKVATDYAGIGDKTAALEAARAAAARAQGYQDNTKLALTQTDLQDTQLTTLSGLATQLQKAIQDAVGNDDGSTLIQTAQSIFEQASSILNSTDANGNYLYGGENSDTPPFTATSLQQLAGGNVSDFFANGSRAKAVLVGDGQSQQIGVLADGVGTQLMEALKTLYNLDSPSGSFSGQLTSDQTADLSSQALPAATTAVQGLNAATAENGTVYKTLQNSISDQQSQQQLYEGFVSDIEDVDMAQALTKLSANQIALQAALQVASRLGQLSLLNYLPST